MRRIREPGQGRRTPRWVLCVTASILIALFASTGIFGQSAGADAPSGTEAPATAHEMLDALGRMPVLFEGRSMPLESAAELVLYRLSGRRRVNDISSTDWMFQVLFAPFNAVEHEVFLVDDPSVLTAIDLPYTERRRYSYAELHPGIERLSELGQRYAALSRPLDTGEQNILRLANNVRLFEGLASTMDIFRGPAEESSYDRYLAGDEPSDTPGELPGMLRLIPAEVRGELRWLTPSAALAYVTHAPSDEAPDGAPAKRVRAFLAGWNVVHRALLAGDPARLEEAAGRLRAMLAEERERGLDLGPTSLEIAYNRLQPARWAALLAVIGFGGSLPLRRSRWLRNWSRTISVGVLALLTVYQIFRFGITLRPPITDLPSSFLFAAWMLSALGTVFVFGKNVRVQTGLVLSSVSTAVLVYMARLITGGGDEFAVVQAVLDTNFWLTTHVLVIVAGYVGVIAAGIVGHVYLVGRIARPYNEAFHHSVFRLMLRISLVGLALTFLGTILGGIWADQSWGRFWGWDPKENGALLIILWSSIALHGRITRWFDQAAFAALTCFGIAVVFFSWLGVNIMGVGLHSYGFSEASYWTLVGVAGFEALFSSTGWIAARRQRATSSGLIPVTVADLSWDDDARCITLRTGDMSYRPGQYIGVRPEGFQRAKPFSLMDGGNGRVRLLVKKNGDLSTYLVERLRVGESLWISRPSGEFRFRTPASRPVVMLAGGIGIAPLLGVLREALRAGNRTVLVRAGRDHLYQEDAVGAIRSDHPELSVLNLLSGPEAPYHPDDETYYNGRMSEELFRHASLPVTIPEKAEWYVCGSPRFCDAGKEIAARFAAREVRVEEFTPIVDAPSVPKVRSRIAIDGLEAEVLPGQTILEAARDSGIPIDHSCMSGSCGECTCRIRAGSVMQAVHPARAGAGDSVVTCVAYPNENDPPSIETEGKSLSSDIQGFPAPERNTGP